VGALRWIGAGLLAVIAGVGVGVAGLPAAADDPAQPTVSFTLLSGAAHPDPAVQTIAAGQTVLVKNSLSLGLHIEAPDSVQQRCDLGVAGTCQLTFPNPSGPAGYAITGTQLLNLLAGGTARVITVARPAAGPTTGAPPAAGPAAPAPSTSGGPLANDVVGGQGNSAGPDLGQPGPGGALPAPSATGLPLPGDDPTGPVPLDDTALPAASARQNSILLPGVVAALLLLGVATGLFRTLITEPLARDDGGYPR
jgi:hypothetical protein